MCNLKNVSTVEVVHVLCWSAFVQRLLNFDLAESCLGGSLKLESWLHA